jgi:hypothetical protein
MAEFFAPGISIPVLQAGERLDMGRKLQSAA